MEQCSYCNVVTRTQYQTTLYWHFIQYSILCGGRRPGLKLGISTESRNVVPDMKVYVATAGQTNVHDQSRQMLYSCPAKHKHI